MPRAVARASHVVARGLLECYLAVARASQVVVNSVTRQLLGYPLYSNWKQLIDWF